jgi:NADH:ubiquinone oxidoreductase subunit 6 (subunit J)
MFDLIGKAAAQGIPTIPSVTPGTFGGFFTRVVNVALYVGGGIAVIYLIYGGIMYVTAGGDQEKATAGRTAIVNAIIGIVIIALALAIVTWVGNALGNTQPGAI